MKSNPMLFLVVKTMCPVWFHPLSSLIALHIEDLYSWCVINRHSNGSIDKVGYKYHVFVNDKEIRDLVIPNGINTITSFCFYCFGFLNSVTIPSSVSRISKDAFGGCTDLTSVISLNPTPPEITEVVFHWSIYDKATLFVPKGSKTLYWLHPYWEKFKNIEEIEVSGVEPSYYIPSPIEDGCVYNIKGERLSTKSDGIKKLPKGIYIKNRKKIIIK